MGDRSWRWDGVRCEASQGKAMTRWEEIRKEKDRSTTLKQEMRTDKKRGCSSGISSCLTRPAV